jgi:drug/metabolite transporter (DMT)-like permease
MAESIPTLPLLAVLLSAALHAGWNAALKGASDKPAASVLLSLVSVFAAGGFGVGSGMLHITVAAIPWVIGSACVEIAYFSSLALAMERLPLGTAYGLSRGLGLLLVWPLSFLAFDERASGLDLVGVALLCGGLFSMVRGARSRSGVLIAVACGCAIAFYPVCYKRALAEGIDPFSLFVGSVGLSVPGQWLLLRGDRRARLRAAIDGDLARIAFAGMLCAASFSIFLSLLSDFGPGRITGLRNASVVFATLYSMALGEERTARDLLGSLAVCGGCVLLA